MEASAQTLQIQCQVDGQSTQGRALRRTLPKGERVQRAARVGAIGTAATLGAVLIPILHFVLVPAFFVLTAVIAVTTYLEDGEVIEAEIACPNCHHAITWQRQSEDWPKTTRCPGCSYTLKIEIV